eukprot:Filipodium_phascolosomae@DN1515_c0_g1_i1.p1
MLPQLYSRQYRLFPSLLLGRGISVRWNTSTIFASGFNDLDESGIQSLFAQIGPVVSIKMLKRPNDTSMGAFLVEFQRPQSATQAVWELDKKLLNQRQVHVAPYEKREAIGVREWGRTRAHPNTDGCGIFVTHSGNVTVKDMRDHLRKNGIPFEELRGGIVSRTFYTLIDFKTPQSAKSAITRLNNTRLRDERLLACASTETIGHNWK